MIDEQATPPAAAPMGAPAESEVEAATIAALTRQLGERDHAFGKLKTELEQTKTDAAASSARAAAEAAAPLTAALTDAAAKYQALIVQTNPEIPAELIKGNTVAELEASLASGKAIVQKVKESLDAQAQATPVPPGAPTRQGIDLSNLSAHEKIIEGLKQRDRS
jgi:hypothetical protein